MKHIKLILLVLAFPFASTHLSAIHPISSDWVVEHEVKKDEVNKKMLLERLSESKVGKWILKKITNQEQNRKDITSTASVSLILGIASFVFLLLIMISSGLYFFYAAYILAIIGALISVIPLYHTRKNKAEYQKARLWAWIGLILSLNTILAPLFLLLILWLAYL